MEQIFAGRSFRWEGLTGGFTSSDDLVPIDLVG